MYKRLLLVTLLFLSILSIGFYTNANMASAQALEGGCYEKSQIGGDYYVQADCPGSVDDLLRETGDCILLSGTDVVEAGECDNTFFSNLPLAEEGDPDFLSEDDKLSSEDEKIRSDCPKPGPDGKVDKDAPLSSENCEIIRYVVNGINFLTAAAGMVIIFSIMYSGYQYMTARDNSSWVQEARHRIAWALVALLIMIFMYAFLNWLVPGGVLPN